MKILLLIVILLVGVLPVQAKGTEPNYIHTEFDDDCNSCHNFPELVHEFTPMLRIKQDGTIVSVLNVDGNACTLYSGEVIECHLLHTGPPLPPCNDYQLAMK